MIENHRVPASAWMARAGLVLYLTLLAIASTAASPGQQVQSFNLSFKLHSGLVDVEVQAPKSQFQEISPELRERVLDKARKTVLELIGNQLERAYGTIWCSVVPANEGPKVMCGPDSADVHDPDETPLMLAVWKRDYEAFRKILATGADVNAQDQSGSTALDEAVIRGSTDVVKDLLQAGANTEVRTKSGWTALLLASATHDPLEILRELIRSHADVQAKEEEGRTGLFIAATYDMIDVMKALIEAGAEVNSRANDGKTPLISAAAKGQLDAVKLLVDAGADLKARDKSGQDALDLARAKGQKEVASFLEEAMQRAGL